MVLNMGGKVQLSAQYQSLLYSKGYEHALGWWHVVDVETDRVKLQPWYGMNKVRSKCIGFLVVPYHMLAA